MKSWLINLLLPALIRHTAQWLGGVLLATGFFVGQENQVRSVVLQLVGIVLSAFAASWAGRESTPSAVLRTATQLPEVVRDKTRIVVNDRNLAMRTPSEVVYGQDMSIQ